MAPAIRAGSDRQTGSTDRWCGGGHCVRVRVGRQAYAASTEAHRPVAGKCSGAAVKFPRAAAWLAPRQGLGRETRDGRPRNTTRDPLGSWQQILLVGDAVAAPGLSAAARDRPEPF